MFSFHYVEGTELKSRMYTLNFPNGDLGKCLSFLEDETLKIMKRGSSGNGRSRV